MVFLALVAEAAAVNLFRFCLAEVEERSHLRSAVAERYYLWTAEEEQRRRRRSLNSDYSPLWPLRRIPCRHRTF